MKKSNSDNAIIKVVAISDNPNLFPKPEYFRDNGIFLSFKNPGNDTLNEFDLVIYDLDENDNNQHVLKEHSDLPVIVLVSKNNIQNMSKLHQKNIFQTLVKPISQEQILLSIKQIFTLHKNIYETRKQFNQTNYSLANANVNLLAAQEKLTDQNIEMEHLLEQVHKNREEMQAIFDSSPNVMVMVNSDGKITTTNNQVEQHFGLRQESVIESAFDEFVDNISNTFENSDDFKALISKLETKDSKPNFESTAVHKMFKRALPTRSTPTRYIATFVVPVYNKITHKILGRLWTFVDITRFKQADEQLHALIEVSPIPYIITRMSDGTVLYANQQLADLVGVDINTAIGKKTPDFYADKNKRTELVSQIEKHGEVKNHELEIRKSDGTTMWMVMSIVKTEIGGEPALVGAFYDIHERKLAEEKLHLYRQIYLNNRDAIVIFDELGNFIECNPAHKTQTGYADEDLEGSHANLLIKNSDLKIGPSLMETGYFRGEVESLTKDKSVKDIDLSIFPIREKNNDIKCFIGIARDITERIESDKIIRQAHTELTEANINLKNIIRERAKAETNLAQRLKYEEGLAKCSQALLSDKGYKHSLVTALKSLRETCDVSIAYIAENIVTEHGPAIQFKYIDNINPNENRFISDSLDEPVQYIPAFQRWYEKLSAGESIWGKVENFPKAEKVYLEKHGVVSLLILPIFVDGHFFGFIGFDDINDSREWHEKDVNILKLAAEMLGGYISKKRAETALALSERQFRSLVENSNDIIFSLTPDGHFKYVSPKIKDYTGYSVEEHLGKHFTWIMNPDDIETGRLLWVQKSPETPNLVNFEYRILHKDGSLRWLVTNATQLQNENGEVVEIVGVTHDITNMRRMLIDLENTNIELRATQAKLVQSEKMGALGMLVAGIAHEINTPIGAITSMHNTLIRAVDKLNTELVEKNPELFENNKIIHKALEIINDANRVIENGTDRVTNIVRRLRSFARLDEADLKTADIHEGIEDTLILIHHEIKHDITVHKNFGDIPKVPCFPGRLNQVFLNLFINAKQAIEGKGKITISTYTRENMIGIDIADSGRGIQTDIVDRIFDPGFTTKGVGVGTGLGLSICYQIMEDHLGSISVKSEKGKGSTFTLLFPMNLDVRLGKSNK